MNELKIQLDSHLQDLTISPALEARILSGTASQTKPRRAPLRTAVILITVLCLLSGTVAAVVRRSWGHTKQGFMTWEEYREIFPYAFDCPPSWDADQERYVLNYHLDIPAYSREFTWEQANKLFHYRNGQKDSVGGGIFTYDTLTEAQEELGVCYLQSDALALDGPISMRTAGSHRSYQLVARYQLRDASGGRSISMEAILHEGLDTEIILSSQPEQIPEMADCRLEKLDTDVTLVKVSDTNVMYVLLADTISYNGHILFDQPPKDLFSAALEVLETLHP